MQPFIPQARINLSPFPESFCPGRLSSRFYRAGTCGWSSLSPSKIFPSHIHHFLLSVEHLFSLPDASACPGGFVNSLSTKCMTKASLLTLASAPRKVLIHIPFPAKAEVGMNRFLLVLQSLHHKSPLFVSEPADLLANLGSF